MSSTIFDSPTAFLDAFLKNISLKNNNEVYSDDDNYSDDDYSDDDDLEDDKYIDYDDFSDDYLEYDDDLNYDGCLDLNVESEPKNTIKTKHYKLSKIPEYYLNWDRFADSSDPIRVCFDDNVRLHGSFDEVPTIILKNIKPTDPNYCYDFTTNQELKKYINNARDINFITYGSWNWSKQDLLNFAKFLEINNPIKKIDKDVKGSIKVNGEPLSYFLIEDDLCLNDEGVIEYYSDYLDITEILKKVNQGNIKNLFIESTQETGKTELAHNFIRYFFDVPVICLSVSASLRDDASKRFMITNVDENWYANKPHPDNFMGAGVCFDSVDKIVNYLNENNIKNYFCLVDECSQGIAHLHFSSTEISNKRALVLEQLSELLRNSSFNLFLDADMYSSTVTYLETKLSGNILKIRNDFQKGTEIINWINIAAMLNAMVEVKTKNPESSILLFSQAKEFDSSKKTAAAYSPTNLRLFLLGKGFIEDDIELLDSETIHNPQHPSFNIHKDPYKFEYYFTKHCKGKIIIGNISYLRTGVNISKHCFDYQFSICQGKMLPTDCIQSIKRLRNSKALERHVFINPIGLDNPRYKGRNPQDIFNRVEQIKTLTNDEYERLGGKIFKQLRSDIDSEEYVAKQMYIQSKLVGKYREITLALMEFKHGWKVEQSDFWIQETGFDAKKIADEVIETKQKIKQIKKQSIDTVLASIQNTQLEPESRIKMIKESKQSLSKEDKDAIARFEFERASLGLYKCNHENIQKWKDGYFRKLRFMFFLAANNTEIFNRLNESVLIEKNNKNGAIFDLDRLKYSNLAAIKYLKDLGVDILLIELFMLIDQDKTNITRRFIKDNKETFNTTIREDGVTLQTQMTGIKLDLDSKSELFKLAENLRKDPAKTYNLLRFSPSKTPSSIIQQLLELFGYSRKSNGKGGKNIKHYVVLEHDEKPNERMIFFSCLMSKLHLKTDNPENPYSDFIDRSLKEETVTSDAKAIRDGLLNSDEVLNIKDLMTSKPPLTAKV